MKRSGYTLLELILVIGIIGILLSVAVWQIQTNQSREMDAMLSDLRFARTYAVSSKESVKIHFDKELDSYQIVSASGKVLKENKMQHIDIRSFHWINATQTIYSSGAFEKCGHMLFRYQGETYRLNFTVGVADITVGGP